MSPARWTLRKRVWMAASALLLAVFAVLSLFGIGCEAGHGVTFVNNTPYRLRIYDGEGDFEFELKPFETSTFSWFKHLWASPTVAKTQDGRAVFSIDLTWEELKAQGWRVVMEEQGSPP